MDKIVDSNGMNTHLTLQEKIDLLRLTSRLTGVPIHFECLKCAHFNSDNHYCYEHKDTVPAEYIGKGCDKLELDIPF